MEDILKRKKVPAANLKFALNDIEAGKIVMAQTDHSGKHHEAYRFDYGIAVKINKHTQVAIQRLIAHKYAIFDPTNPQVEDKHGYDVGVQLFTTPKFVQLRMLLDKPIKESLDEAVGSKMRWRSDRLDRDRVVGTGSEFHDSFLADNAGNYKEMQAILKDVKAGKVVITGTIVHPSEMTSVGLWNSSSERMSRYTGKKLQIALDMLDEGLFYATKLIEKKAGTIDAKPVGYLAKLTQWGKELEGALPALMRKSK